MAAAARARPTIPCICWPTSRRLGCTASSTAVRQPGLESAGARADPDASEPTRQHAEWPTATWCGCSTTAAVAWPGVVIDDRVRPDVVQLSTGAWFDPADTSDPDAMCVHGNPNVLTDDVGTSSLAHGCTGAHVLVEVEKFNDPLPPVTAHQPPVIRSR